MGNDAVTVADGDACVCVPVVGPGDRCDSPDVVVVGPVGPVILTKLAVSILITLAVHHLHHHRHRMAVRHRVGIVVAWYVPIDTIRILLLLLLLVPVSAIVSFDGRRNEPFGFVEQRKDVLHTLHLRRSGLFRFHTKRLLLRFMIMTTLMGAPLVPACIENEIVGVVVGGGSVREY